MIAPVRIAAALVRGFQRLEPRHWVGLGASVALHLAVLLGWKPEQPPEPQPISFEIVLEPPGAKPVPESKMKAAARKKPPRKLARKAKSRTPKLAEQKSARPNIAISEPHLLTTNWRTESGARNDAPALALPEASALGLHASTQGVPVEVANVAGKPQLKRAAQPAANSAARSAMENSPGLSEPEAASAGSEGGRPGETGLVPANALALSASQGISPGTSTAGAQVNASPALLAGGSGHSGRGESLGNLHSTTAPQVALNAASGVGMMASVAAPVTMHGGVEPQGVRLTASGALANVPTSTSGAGAVSAGPQSVSLAQESHQSVQGNTSTSGVGDGSVLQGNPVPTLGATINATARPGSGQASLGESGATRRGRGQEMASRLGTVASQPVALMGGASNVNTPSRSGHRGETVALAPGEPGGSPRFAVTMQPVLASRSNPYLPARSAQAGIGTSGESGSDANRAMSSPSSDSGVRSGGGNRFSGSVTGTGPASESGRAQNVASKPAGLSAAPAYAASAAVLNTAREAGHPPVVLHAAQPVAVKVVRPDTEVQRLDVLAPSNYCPLPLPGHIQPENRAPQTSMHRAEQPAYAVDNPEINYPVLANIRGVEGRVTVRVEVLADGRPGKMWLKQSSGSGILDHDAQDQLKHWRFVPARKNGQPVSAWIDVPVVYRLSQARP